MVLIVIKIEYYLQYRIGKRRRDIIFNSLHSFFKLTQYLGLCQKLSLSQCFFNFFFISWNWCIKNEQFMWSRWKYSICECAPPPPPHQFIRSDRKRKRENVLKIKYTNKYEWMVVCYSGLCHLHLLISWSYFSLRQDRSCIVSREHNLAATKC